MSTNYYFVNKKSKEHNSRQKLELTKITSGLITKFERINIDESKYRNIIYSILDLESLIDRIHIGKRSSKWKPLFQTQKVYSNISEMKKWYMMNQSEWLIESEYGEVFTWEQLEDELINWNSNGFSWVEGDYSNEYKVIDGYEWTDGEFS